VHITSVRLGGQNITNDIARGLSTPTSQAEHHKTIKGNILQFGSNQDQERIEIQRIGDLDGSSLSNSITRGSLSSIILPRVEEIMEFLRDDLQAHGIDHTRYQNVVLNGGASLLTGAEDFVGKIFNRPARIATPRLLQGMPEATTGPDFAAPIGVVTCLDVHAEHPKIDAIKQPKGQFGKMAHWLKDSFFD
ncbi:MAG: cell division FtsA domain-containing protein, partial [Pseudomonadota bacterium]